MRPFRLALCGTFDKLTFGDALASLVIEDALQRRVDNLTLVRYAYGARSASSWPFEVRSLDGFERDIPSLSGVLVGNLETQGLSSNAHQNSPPNGEIHDSAGIWLAPALAALTAGLPVCWNSAAVHDIPDWCLPSLAFALSLSRYVSARDETVVATFRNAGFTGDSPVVPSVLFDVPRLVAGRKNGAPCPEVVQSWLRATSAGDDYVVVQDHEDIRPLLSDLERLLERRGLGLVLLALPQDDVPTAAEKPVAERPAMVPRTPENIAALIGHSVGVVALDEAVITTALAYEIPLLLPAGSQLPGKAFTADEVVIGVPDDPLPSAFLDRLGTFALGASARLAASVLDVHWDNLAAKLTQRSADVQSATLAPYRAWNRFLIASQEQAQCVKSVPSSPAPLERADIENPLRAELEHANAALAEERAQRQLEAGLHETWRTAAERRRSETEVERQRLQEMKHSFDAALDALTHENAALRHESATLQDTLRQLTVDLRARKDELDHLRSSLSWRLTGPLRTAKDAWRSRQR